MGDRVWDMAKNVVQLFDEMSAGMGLWMGSKFIRNKTIPHTLYPLLTVRFAHPAAVIVRQAFGGVAGGFGVGEDAEGGGAAAAEAGE